MFPSAGLFSLIDCPFSVKCERLYCPYKHLKEAEHSGHDDHNATSGTCHNQKQSYTRLTELEKINQQIEAVRSEMEKEQKKLFRYQSEQAESTGASTEEYQKTREMQDQNGNQLKCKRKYVVDRTRPKTDLEYDPCSNFSAALRPGSSADKIRSTNKADIKCEQIDKTSDISVPVDQVQLSSCSFEESDDEGMLVIDMPALEGDGCLNRSPKQNIEKIMEESPNRASDMLPLEKMNRPAKEGTSMTEEMGSPQKTVLRKVTSLGLPRQSMVKGENMSSEGLYSPLENTPNIGEQKPLIQHKLVEELDSSIRMIESDDLPVEKHKLHMKQSLVSCLTAVPNCHENARLSLRSVPKSSQGCHLENSTLSNNGDINGSDVLDNISMCLDHLRRESESITYLKGMKDLIDLVPSAPICSKTDGGSQLQPINVCAQSLDIKRPESEIQHTCLSGSVQKLDTLPSRQLPETPHETVAFHHCFPTTSASVMTQNTQNPIASVESWPPAQTVLTELVQNVPKNSVGSNTIDVSAAQPVLNPAAKQVDLAQDQIPQKTSASDVIQLDSSSSEELNYSDLDLSESDPMEECYRIFMEANSSKDPPVQGDMPAEFSKISETEMVKLPPAQKKRVAHVARFEATKSNKQVIVPLRDGGFQVPVPSRSQQCQKVATALTAVKGSQAFISASTINRVLTPAVFRPAPLPNGCVNIIPAGATLRLGPNLHLIVPEGSCAVPVALIPAATVPAVRPIHQPAPIPQPVPPPNYTPAKSIPMKRKAKGRVEVGVKVPHDVRQRYVNLFVEEFLKTSATVQDAFEKALAEEKTVFDRSVNKLKYLSIAVNALKRLKNQNATPAKFSSGRDAQASRGNVPLITQALLGTGDVTLYDQLKEHVLTKTLLRENNYPFKHPVKEGFAIQYGDTKKNVADASRIICCRCGTSFSVSKTGKHTRKEECNYHYGKVIENRVPGGVETHYSCCENAVGSPGCQVFKLHVHDAVSLQDFVSSLPQNRAGCPGIYAIDTEMCYTIQGLELVRVTMVNSSLQVIYDTFVKPDGEVIDYNTRFSGVSEDDVKSSSSSLRDVQAVLLSFIAEETILIGHNLENDLCALKLIHSTVVDTSVAFPHRLGPPHKRDLRSLTAEYLRKIIQESVEGHDTREDATACMELMLWKVKEDAKGKRW